MREKIFSQATDAWKNIRQAHCKENCNQFYKASTEVTRFSYQILQYSRRQQTYLHQENKKKIRIPIQSKINSCVKQNEFFVRVTFLSSRISLRENSQVHSQVHSKNAFFFKYFFQVPKRATRFSDKVRNYLQEKFDVGNTTGHKADPVQVLSRIDFNSERLK